MCALAAESADFRSRASSTPMPARRSTRCTRRPPRRARPAAPTRPSTENGKKRRVCAAGCLVGQAFRWLPAQDDDDDRRDDDPGTAAASAAAAAASSAASAPAAASAAALRSAPVRTSASSSAGAALGAGIGALIGSSQNDDMPGRLIAARVTAAAMGRRPWPSAGRAVFVAAGKQRSGPARAHPSPRVPRRASPASGPHHEEGRISARPRSRPKSGRSRGRLHRSAIARAAPTQNARAHPVHGCSRSA